MGFWDYTKTSNAMLRSRGYEVRDRIDELLEYERPTLAQRSELDEHMDEQRAIEAEQKVRRERNLEKIHAIATGADPDGRIERGSQPADMLAAPPSRVDSSPSGQLRERARRTLDGLRSVHDDGKERLTRAFERVEASPDSRELDALSRWLLVTSAPAYTRAVAKLFRDPMNGHREFDSEELAAYQDAKMAQRAMTLTPDTAGGFLVPTHLDPQIMLSNAGVIDPIRQIARVETIATDTWNGVSSAGVTASWDAEATEVSDDSPTLAGPAVPAYKGAAFVAASLEAAMDASIGEQVTTLFMDAKQRLEGTAFVTGSGSGQPTGVVTSLAAGQKVATATADVLVRDDVTKPAVALPPRWQPNAAYIANNATAIAVGAFETTAGALRYPEINGSPPRLLRKPFHEHSAMNKVGDTATAGNDNVLLLGDWRNYLIADRVGATVEYIPHLVGTNHRPTGQRGWYMYWRTGGDCLIDDAFRLLTA